MNIEVHTELSNSYTSLTFRPPLGPSPVDPGPDPGPNPGPGPGPDPGPDPGSEDPSTDDLYEKFE
jgi:hypothetical protein